MRIVVCELFASGFASFAINIIGCNNSVFAQSANVEVLSRPFDFIFQDYRVGFITLFLKGTYNGRAPSTSTTALRVVVLTWIVIVFMVDTSKNIIFILSFPTFSVF